MRTLSISLAVFAFVFGAFVFAGNAHAAECHTRTAADPVPAGFGAPFNPFSSSQELLLTADCSGDTATLNAGTGAQNQYVYNSGYYHDGEKWQQASLSGDESSGDWFKGQAQMSIPLSGFEEGDTVHAVAYVCQYRGGEWKCGCRDEACEENMWQLQRIKMPGLIKPYKFNQFVNGVNIVDRSSGEILQTILLEDIPINSPKSSFAEVYGSELSMQQLQEDSPAILTSLDVNFDGYIDLGILVDTLPIEDGYVFYLYNQSNEQFLPAKLDPEQPAAFVVYDPAVNASEQTLRGNFTVTNPRRVKYFEYVFDEETGIFFKKHASM